MKATVVASLIALASTGYAAPVNSQKPRDEAAANSFFGGHKGGIIGDIFDSATCVVSGFIGGGNPLCFKDQGDDSGNGKGALEHGPEYDGSDDDDDDNSSSSSSSSSSHDDDDDDDDSSKSDSDSSSSSSSSASQSSYNFNYDTNSDGTYKITITPSKGDPCTYDSIDGKGKPLQEVIGDAAARCV